MDQLKHAEAPAANASATPEQRAKAGYNATARLAGADCARFTAAATFLRSAGLSAPEIISADPAAGFVLLEDFGERLYSDEIVKGGDELALYKSAVEALVRLHEEGAPAELAPDMPLFAYDEMALIAEADLFTQWFMPLALGRSAAMDEVEDHRALWRAALAILVSQKPVFVHRDYHAQNLLWLPERTGARRTGMIDFQDAVAGDPAYDLVSLLEDARRDVAPELTAALMAHYCNKAGITDKEAFVQSAAVIAAQRNVKIAGIFARLAKRDGNTRYLSHLPRVWRYLENDLSHPALRALKTWYDHTIPASVRRNALGGRV